MRFILSAVFVALMCGCLSAAEIDAESAIQEAISGLEAKLPNIKSSADKKKIAVAVESLKSKLSKSKSTSTDAKKIDAAALEAKFKGKAEYNAKTGDLTIVYDFKNEDQLEDFILWDDAATPKIVGGKVMLGGKDALKHKVEFSKFKVSADFAPKQFDGTQRLLWFNAPGRLEFDMNNQTKQLALRLFSAGDQIADGSFQPKTPLSITCEVSNNKMRVKYANREIVGDRKVAGTAGHVHLYGGTEGMAISKVTIQGVPEQLWLESFMEE